MSLLSSRRKHTTEAAVSHFYVFTKTTVILPSEFFCYTYFSKVSFAADKSLWRNSQVGTSSVKKGLKNTRKTMKISLNYNIKSIKFFRNA